jgi:hexosaminidase
MPQPASVQPAEGKLVIDASFRVALAGYREARLDAAAARLASRVALETGTPGPAVGNDPSSATLVIECRGPGEEDESYTLDVSPKQARIVAAAPVGALHGIETFVQLLSADATGFSVPALRIEDRPRFRWRGLLIDVARHFMPVEQIERNLDGMAAVKLNVLHWHLSDDQGFRVESKRFPRLQEMGSDGLYYTQGEVRRVIAYAHERGIRVVPEFDMPGHTTAWFVGYPEIASAPGPYQIERHWGVFDPAMDPTREEVYQFLDGLIGEMTALFPDPYFHVGGDEVNGKQWDQNPEIQKFMRAHGIQSNEELQTYFSKRVMAIVTAHGKKVIGWDEVLSPGLPKDAVVQSWRGPKGLADAVRQGYQVILSNGYYLDMMLPAAVHYAVDPLGGAAAGLTPEERARVLGGEACQWAELITSENADARIWPRLAAIAERLWSPQDVVDVASMYHRLEITSVKLDYLGLTHRTGRVRMLERIAGFRAAGALVTLSTALEPVKGYARHPARVYTQFTPLNRMVDATRPESDTVREFSRAVDALLGGDTGERESVRKRLLLWRAQHAELKDVFAESFLAAEVEPVSKDVAALATAGLEALDYIEAHATAPPAWAAAQKELLDRVRTPRAELLMVLAAPIQKLVSAAR